jgi:2-iminoacetate synthase
MSYLPKSKRVLSKDAVDFIDEDQLHGLMQRGSDPVQFEEILAKSVAKEPLTPEESAVLLNADDPEQHRAHVRDRAAAQARGLRQSHRALRSALRRQLCINDCSYCGFRRSNPTPSGARSSRGELIEQVQKLEDTGHKRLILVFGEHPHVRRRSSSPTRCARSTTKSGHGEIRRVNINAAPLDHEGYASVKEAGIGTYQVFQETYHHETYDRGPPAGTRSRATTSGGSTR